MNSSSSSFINPLSLSLPSPSSDTSSPSPLAATDAHSAGPSRKRARSDITPEERKEARAHRNRLAAQNSRDKRKAQFSALERRVAELEEENRQLRAGITLPNDNERERDLAREKENEDLRERVKSLEKGWEAVVKALAAQGLPAGISVPSPVTSTTTKAETTPSPSSSTTTFPVLIPDPTFPISPISNSPISSSSLFGDDIESTRHLAAGGLDETNELHLELFAHPQPSLGPTTDGYELTSPTSAIDEAAMESLFREILAPSPSMPSTALPPDAPASALQISAATATSASEAPLMVDGMDWAAGEVEMQRLLDMLPVHSDVDVGSLDVSAALDLELCNWEYTTVPSGVGVF